MEYYVIRIYRREPRRTRRGLEDTRLTGLVENELGRRESFRSAEQLSRLLVRNASDGGRSGRNPVTDRRVAKRNTRGATRRT